MVRSWLAGRDNWLEIARSKEGVRKWLTTGFTRWQSSSRGVNSGALDCQIWYWSDRMRSKIQKHMGPRVMQRRIQRQMRSDSGWQAGRLVSDLHRQTEVHRQMNSSTRARNRWFTAYHQRVTTITRQQHGKVTGQTGLLNNHNQSPNH